MADGETTVAKETTILCGEKCVGRGGVVRSCSSGMEEAASIIGAKGKERRKLGLQEVHGASHHHKQQHLETISECCAMPVDGVNVQRKA